MKNLESLQGDERDVILISVGYARDSSGFFGMSFGPLSSSGGERRLNVLISRARQRCEVFSSITGDDIDLSRAKSRGAAALKTFLKYAQAGILDIGAPSGRECDSEFELEVKRSLEQHGLQVDTQVGVAGFYIDLAIRDPDQPGRYLLGIECDGATYHSSRGARDRDRLRQQVLEDREWVIHRIWSTDWFKDRDEQIRRTLQAVEAAKAGTWEPPFEEPAEEFVLVDPNELATEVTIDQDVDLPAEEVASLDEIAQPYQEAELRVRTDQPLHEVPVGGLARVALEVVRVEAPVHRDEITRRLASYWGVKRVSGRTSEAVQRALDYAVREKLLDTKGDFYLIRGQQEIPVRRRDKVTSVKLRDADMLPPDEIRKAVIHIVQMHLGAGNDELVVATSRLLGFRSTRPTVRQAIAQVVDELVQEGSLRRNNDRLYAG